MIDKHLDKQLMDLNQRYQAIARSQAYVGYTNKNRYLYNLKHLNIRSIISDLRYRSYGKRNFSTKGNSLICNEEIQNVSNFKIAVYSCVVGRYDPFIEPVYCERDIDYYMFTDQELSKCSVWKKIDISNWDDYKQLSPLMLNRKLKILQNELLLTYDYTIYVDGNVEIVAGVSPLIARMKNFGFGVHYHRSRDCIVDEVVSVKHLKRLAGKEMDKQIANYLSQGFPRHNGLFENSILVRDNRNVCVQALMRYWWDEYNKYQTRDQLSLPYVIWKTKFDTNKILILGSDVEMNPRFNRLNVHLQ
ncbi:glycosyltransferase domain-containing protein [Candidatus Ventrimonas sp. KK005]|nr:DUF616 domain-containing protein [Clostridiaceae bacterium]